MEAQHGMRVRPSPQPEIAFKINGADYATLRVDADLVRRASAPIVAKKPADWRETTDHWKMRVLVMVGDTQRGYAEFDYWTGVGNRANPTKARLSTLLFYNESVPIKPRACDFLYSIGMDVRTADEMPRDDGAAMDYLEDEMGKHEGRASEVLAQVRELRAAHDKVRKMLATSGITLADFIAWTEELES